MARKKSVKFRLTQALIDLLSYQLEHGEEYQDIWDDIVRDFDLTSVEINGFKVKDYVESRAFKSWLRDIVTNTLSSFEYIAEMNERSETPK